jgi:hypothetical protein
LQNVRKPEYIVTGTPLQNARKSLEILRGAPCKM